MNFSIKIKKDSIDIFQKVLFFLVIYILLQFLDTSYIVS